jgi:hypothetical protein
MMIEDLIMAERTCIKCLSPVRAERSAIRLTLRCTNQNCGYTVVKNIVPKGFG